MTAPVPATARPADSYWLTRFVMLRLFGAVYAVAFFVAAKQILPLIGSNGLTPLNLYITQIRASHSRFYGFIHLPSFFWFAHSDAVLQIAAWIGFALACVVVAATPTPSS